MHLGGTPARPGCWPPGGAAGSGPLVAMLVALNLLVFVIFPGWPLRAMVLLVSLLVAPVLHTMLFRR